jgi:hypothetical protein
MGFGLVILPGEMGPRKCGGHLPAKGGFGLLNHYHGFQKRYVDVLFCGALTPVVEKKM